MMPEHINKSLRTKALAKLEQFADLPSMPQIINRVREISENPKSSAADLANIILADHSLTTRILRIANSAFYGQYSGKVSTITQAIVLMGFNAVRNTVMGIAVYDSFAKLEERAEFDLTSFWTRSLGCGVVAKGLAVSLRLKSSEEAFIAGFMHDIGQPVMCMAFADDVPRIGLLVSRLDDPVRHEREDLGIDHQEVGEWLGRKWNLPPVLLKPMRHHHRIGMGPLEKSPFPLVDLIYSADMIINKLADPAIPNDEIAELVGSDLHRLLGINKGDLARIIGTATTLTREIAGDLQIRITGFDASAKSVPPAPAERVIVTPPEYLETVQRLSEAERELAIFREVGVALRESTSEEEILQTLLEGVYRGLGFARVLLLRIDRATHRAQGLLGFGVSSQQQVHDVSITLKDGTGAIVTCVTKNKLINILDSSSDIYQTMLDDSENEAFASQSFCLLPIAVGDDVEYVVFLDDGRAVADDKARSAESFVNQAAMALERFRLRALVAQTKPANDVDSLITVAFNK